MNTNKPSKSGKYLDADTWDAMKAAGFSEAELEQDQPEGPMIFSYTRRMAVVKMRVAASMTILMGKTTTA